MGHGLWRLSALGLRGHPTCQLNYTRDIWVKRMQMPDPDATDEVKLRCRDDGGTWIVWVPSHG